MTSAGRKNIMSRYLALLFLSGLLFTGCVPQFEASPGEEESFGTLDTPPVVESRVVDGVAQPAELPRRMVPYDWSSGIVDGQGGARAATMAVSDTISVPGSPWLQLRFGDVTLGSDSYIEVVSLLDNSTQVLDAEGLEKWRGRSAFFNGDSVEIRLFVGPQDQGVFMDLAEVVAGERTFQPRSI